MVLLVQYQKVLLNQLRCLNLDTVVSTAVMHRHLMSATERSPEKHREAFLRHSTAVHSSNA